MFCVCVCVFPSRHHQALIHTIITNYQYIYTLHLVEHHHQLHYHYQAQNMYNIYTTIYTLHLHNYKHCQQSSIIQNLQKNYAFAVWICWV